MSNKTFIKRFLISIFLLLIPLITSAEEQVNIGGENFVVVIDVNIRNSSIISQDNNKLDIGFELSNGKGAQSDIKYSARLVKEDENKKRSNVYQKIYDDKVTLSENSKIQKNISLEVPNYLDGEYELWLIAENKEGMPLSSNIVGKIKVESTNNEYIDISNCYLTIKGLPQKYSLGQGVDIAKEEELIMICDAESYYTTAVSPKVAIDTFKRSVYGDKIIVDYIPQDISFEKKEKKKIEINIPKILEPQSYDVTVTLKDNDKEISNTINAHYVIQGESVTVSNLQLDKTSYIKGDKLTVSFLWALSADGFLGSRKSFKEEKDNRVLYYNLSVLNKNNEECIQRVKHKELEKNVLINKGVNDVMLDCDNPKVLFAIEDETGKILLEKTYNFVPTETDKVIEPKQEIKKELLVEKEKKLTTNNIILIVIIILFVLVLTIFALRNKNRNKIMNVFLFLILGGIFFGNNTNKVEASTLYHVYGGEKVSCEYTNNTSNVTPGGQFNITSLGCHVVTCGNEIKINFYMGSTSIPLANSIPSSYNYGSVWVTGSTVNTTNQGNLDYQTSVPSAKTITAVSTAGTYKIPIKYIYNHYMGKTSLNDEVSYINNPVNGTVCHGNTCSISASAGTIEDCRGISSRGKCGWLTVTAKDYFTYNIVVPSPPTCSLSYSPINTTIGNTITGTLTSTNAISAKSGCATHGQPITTLNPSGISGSWPVTSTTEKWIDCKTEVTSSNGKTGNCNASYKFTPPQPTCGTANGYTFAYDDSGWLGKTYCSNNGSVANPIAPIFPDAGTSTNWTCNLNGHNTPCSASRLSAPPSYSSCGTADGYPYIESNTNWMGKTFCDAGFVAIPSSPLFPDAGESTNWTCSNYLGVLTPCSAYRSPEPPPGPTTIDSCYYISSWVPKWSDCDVYQTNVCNQKCSQENTWKPTRTYKSWNCTWGSLEDEAGNISWQRFCDGSCNSNVAKPANETVDKTINIDNCPVGPNPDLGYCGDGITQNLGNSKGFKEACDDGDTDNNDECSNNCTLPHNSQPGEVSISTDYVCDLSDSGYANNSDTNILYATLILDSLPEGYKDIINLGTPTIFLDLSNNTVDRVTMTGDSSLHFDGISIDWDPNKGIKQKVAIATVKSKTPFVSCNNKISFQLLGKTMTLGNIGYNFKKPYVGDLQASLDGSTWNAKPSIGTLTTYKVSAINPKFSSEPSSYDIGLTNDDISYVGKNIILQGTSLLDYTKGPYQFKTRINSSATATELNKTPGIQVILPTISYDVGTDTVKYYLSKYDYGNDKTPIELDGDPFLGVKIIGGLQGAGKYEFTGQGKNISNLYPSDLRTEIRKRAYDYISNMKSGDIINKVKYVNGEDVPISGDLNYETLVVINGNVKITGDLNTSGTSGKKLGIIVLKDNYYTSNGYNEKGNVLVAPGVKTINAIIYADGGFMSADSDGKVYTTDSTDRTNALQKQLTMNGSLFTRNTIGGAQYVGGVYVLPGGTKTDEFDKAMIYDLNYIRRGNDGCDNNFNGNCYDSGEIKEGFIIKYDSRIQTDPPKLFYK